MAKNEDVMLIIAKSFAKQRLTLKETKISRELTVSDLISEYGLNQQQSEAVVKWCKLSCAALSSENSILEESFLDKFRSSDGLKKKKAKQGLKLIKKVIKSSIEEKAFSSPLLDLANRLEKLFRHVNDKDMLSRLGSYNIGQLRLNKGGNVKSVIEDYPVLIDNIIKKIEDAKNYRPPVQDGLKESLSPEYRISGLDLFFYKTNEKSKIKKVQNQIDKKGLVGEIIKICNVIRRRLYKEIRDTNSKNPAKDKRASIDAIYHIDLEIKNDICDALIDIYTKIQKEFPKRFKDASTSLEKLDAILIKMEKEERENDLEDENLPFVSSKAVKKGHKSKQQVDPIRINKNY